MYAGALVNGNNGGPAGSTGNVGAPSVGGQWWSFPVGYGQGGGASTGNNNNGKSGGQGICIVRYSGTQRSYGGSVSSAAGYTLHTFTDTSTFTA